MGRKDRQHGLAAALCLLIAVGGAAACSYEYNEPDHTPTTRPAASGVPPVPYVDPLVLEREVKNYAELDRLLGDAQGPLILLEEGPLDGPERGFGAMAKVPAAGQYNVTSACVGASGATVSVGQEHPGAPFQPMELALDCREVISRMIALEQGFVFAHLVLPVPGDTPWTSAVGGVRVTG